MSSRFDAVYERSLRDPEGFWGEAAEAVAWHRRWDRVLDDTRPPFYRWFAGAEINTCYNAVDLHVETGRGAQPAILYDSPVTGRKARLTYAELRDAVARAAGALARLGVGRGDRVIVYMPMVPEAVVGMLACARLGAVHSVVFGGFASRELAVRIDDCEPKVILSASCGIEPGRVVEYKPLLDGAIDLARHRPDRCVILQRPEHPATLDPARDLDWNDFLAGAEPHECVPVAATDPLYILYTSGTTGQPKGVVRDNGGHVVALKWSMKNIYGVEPGEVFWAASDIGWVVGHSYIVYAPLFAGSTTVLFEGKPVGTPDPGTFWRIISEYGVRVMFTAPTAFRAIKREDPAGEHIGRYDLSAFRTLFLAGERTDPDTLNWARAQLGVPVIDHWWQTETGWSICANCIGIEPLPVKEGSPTRGRARHGRAGGGRARGRGGARADRRPRRQAAASAGDVPYPVEGAGALRRELSRGAPRLLQDRGRGVHGRGRIRLRHVPDRRHHQCGGTSPLHRGRWRRCSPPTRTWRSARSRG